ncbi:MAG: isoprenoid biosynthesis glyoxalase ElbB [Alphaproteobacteria bacterium]|nr:isoprenoid biosynthesis glyoxalase ElbB [Alphaproteobacteria bacterium]
MMKRKNFAVVLSGCGRMDGSEIHESTTLLLALTEAGHTYECFAPNVEQFKVSNNLTSENMLSKRNVMVESARIARGKIKDIKTYSPTDFDGILFPGGMGAVLNLCDYGAKGLNCLVNQDVERAILSTYDDKKPLGAMCIAPVLLAKVMGKFGIEITLGNDKEYADTVKDIKKMGAKHHNIAASGVCVDKANKVVSTPAYMLCQDIKEVYDGAKNFVKEISELK